MTEKAMEGQIAADQSNPLGVLIVLDGVPPQKFQAGERVRVTALKVPTPGERPTRETETEAELATATRMAKFWHQRFIDLQAAGSGAAVRDQRVALGLSLRELAHKCGVSATELGELERGVRVDGALMQRVCAELAGSGAAHNEANLPASATTGVSVTVPPTEDEKAEAAEADPGYLWCDTCATCGGTGWTPSATDTVSESPSAPQSARALLDEQEINDKLGLIRACVADYGAMLRAMPDPDEHFDHRAALEMHEQGERYLEELQSSAALQPAIARPAATSEAIEGTVDELNAHMVHLAAPLSVLTRVRVTAIDLHQPASGDQEQRQ